MAFEWVRLTLDLNAFDEAPFAARLRDSEQAGIEFTTLAALGDGAEHRWALYELNRTCAADIPERGAFYTYEEYLAQRIETPTFDPEGVVLALDSGTWVGMATTSIRPDGFAFSEMTGVLAGHRGRGISLAMKLLAIRFARARGMSRLRTMHHPLNASAIAMNRRLGFVDDAPQLTAS
ncbi:GNAT family N-acetyltransferase [Streptomyces sp. T-3]|nr:GNAT family N-acetyltransferase [Streptomyces sp. T-3]